MVDCPRCKGTGQVPAEGITVGDRFRASRENLGMKQVESAEKIGISRTQITNIEADRTNPSVAVLIGAAGAYGVSTDYLLGVADD